MTRGSRTLSDVCTHIVDCEHKTAPTDDDGTYFAVGTPAMRGNRINYAEARRLNAETFTAWTRRLRPKVGDLLFAREAPVGPVVQIPDEENVAPGQRTVLLRPDTREIHPRFLYYLLASPKEQALLVAKAAGSTVPHLNVADVRSFVLPELPCIEEQQAMAEALGALDDKIAANSVLASTAGGLAEAEWVRVARRAEGTAPLREVATLLYGKSLPASGRVPGAVQVFGSGGITGAHNEALVGQPGVVVGRKGTVGAVYWAAGPHYPIDTTFYVEPTGHLSSEYLYFALQRLGLKEMNSDSAVPGLNRDRAYARPVPVPEPDQLHEFNVVVRTMFTLDARMRAENDALAKTRDTLLPLLMSGKVRVKDVEKRVEEVV